MTTITKLEQQFKDSKPSGFKITLADGTQGYLDERNSEKGLREGDSVEVTVVVPEGKTYKKISAKRVGTPSPLPAPPPTQTSPQPQQEAVKPPMQQGLYSASKSISEMKHDMRLQALETLGMLAAGGRIEPDEIIEIFNKFYPALDSSYDVLNK